MSSRTVLSTLALSIAVLTGGSAAAWVPVACEDRSDELKALRERAGTSTDFRSTWQRFEQAVRDAAPGDLNYVPHPYPQTPRQVFEDFRYAFLNRLVTDPENVASRHRRTFDVLHSDDPRFEVVRVENWEPRRCGSDQAMPFYHLVRIFDGDVEISRAALDDTGILGIFSSLDKGGWPLEDLPDIAATVRKRFGVETEPARAQFVALSGLPVQCSPVVPCVAFQSGGETYLVNRDFFLFAIQPDAPRMSVLELAQQPIDPRGASVNAGRGATAWITVGFGIQQGRLVATGPRGGPLD